MNLLSNCVSVTQYYCLKDSSQIPMFTQPRNITRVENEIDVFIPCPFEFRPAPPIWKILNGTEYFDATLPSIYTQTFGGLFIKIVHRCLNYTSFQCVDISDDTLQGEERAILDFLQWYRCHKENALLVSCIISAKNSEPTTFDRNACARYMYTSDN